VLDFVMPGKKPDISAPASIDVTNLIGRLPSKIGCSGAPMKSFLNPYARFTWSLWLSPFVTGRC
jgi:hypothetical protein